MKTVSASYLISYIDACVQQGANKMDLLRLMPGAGKSLYDKNKTSAEKRFSIDLIFPILAHTAKHTNRPEIGLLCGLSLRPESLNELGSAIMCCSTLRQVIEINRRYQILTQQLGRSNLKIIGEEARLVWEPHYEDAEYGRMVTDVVMAGHAIFGRWLSWVQDKKINAVHLQHAKPAYADKYIEIFDCPVLFSQRENAMLIDVDALDAPLPQANKKTLSEICGRLDVALERLQQLKPIREQVADILYIEVSNIVPNLQQTAKYLGVSPRSLRRGLMEEKTNFRQVLEQTRQKICAELMADNIPFLQIASQLGYSQQSAFNRAFKQWYGATPKAYIRAQGEANRVFEQFAP